MCRDLGCRKALVPSLPCGLEVTGREVICLQGGIKPLPGSVLWKQPVTSPVVHTVTFLSTLCPAEGTQSCPAPSVIKWVTDSQEVKVFVSPLGHIWKHSTSFARSEAGPWSLGDFWELSVLKQCREEVICPFPSRSWSSNTLATWCELRTADTLEKTLILGKIESRRIRGCRGWDGWMASLIQGTWI